MPRPVRPRREIGLQDFIDGIVAVMAIEGRTRLDAAPGLLDVALHHVVRDVAKMADRLRLDLRFRIAADALARPESALARALEAVQDRGDMRLRADGASFEILLHAPAARARLLASDVPVGFYAWAVKRLFRRLPTARLRAAHRARSAALKAPKEPSDPP